MFCPAIICFIGLSILQPTGWQTAESACVAPAAGILAFACCLSVDGWAHNFSPALLNLYLFLSSLNRNCFT
jgi:hypothetical protein